MTIPTPTPYPISDACRPVFPCEMFHDLQNCWNTFQNDNGHTLEYFREWGFIYWRPLQPTAPEPVKEVNIPKDDLGQTHYAKQHGMVCPKCGSYAQIWINQASGKWTCHKVGCHGKGGFEREVLSAPASPTPPQAQGTATPNEVATPRTDALVFVEMRYISVANDMKRMTDFARTLERELEAVSRERDELKGELAQEAFDSNLSILSLQTINGAMKTQLAAAKLAVGVLNRVPLDAIHAVHCHKTAEDIDAALKACADAGLA